MRAAFSHRERREAIERVAREPRQFDLCIVGGGVTGAAIARDAALRGWSVLLVEKNDFASGTSSRSSKLVHGGVRYLENYEFGLVAEATRERARLWKLAPQLVTPLAFLFPAYRDSRLPLWLLECGLWLYDALAAFRTPSLHRLYLRARTLREEPKLRADGLKGAIFYWDGMTDDALLTLANAIDAHEHGAVMLPRVSFTRAEWNAAVPTEASAAHTLHFRDELGGRDFTAQARLVVFATGPWSDEILPATPLKRRKLMAPTRGSHIVVPATKLPAKHAIVMTHPKDGRVLFTIPWDDMTIIGTTDLFDSESPDRVAATNEEVQYLLDASRHYFPDCPLTTGDVVSTWSGLRPLLAPPQDASEAEVSREHHIEWSAPGCLIIAGGKLTTHREMAEQAIERLYEETSHWARIPANAYSPTATDTRPLPVLAPRGESSEPRLGVSKGARLSLNDVRRICREEMVLTLEDLLVRRTHIFYKEPQNGWTLLEQLRPVLCEELGWDAAEWERQKAAYRAYLEKNILKPLARTLA